MTPAIQDTLLQLFEHVRQDPDTLPVVPVDDWQEGSVEWRLLISFQDMLQQVQRRTLQFKQTEEQLLEKDLIRRVHFLVTWVCVRCASVYQTWVGRFRLRVQRDKGQRFAFASQGEGVFRGNAVCHPFALHC
jgi:hypothetical protein